MQTKGGYNATRDDAGVLTVYRVPIFAECARNGVNFDKDWIAAAVAKAKQAEVEGYLPPLHIRHHEPDTTVRAAGFFRIVGTETITFKGTPTLAVMADLIVTDKLVQDEILQRRLPYRSVEIANVKQPALDSLALLDHEAPFLELPMLMVAQPNETEGLVGTFEQGATVPAAFRRGDRSFVLLKSDTDSDAADDAPPGAGEDKDKQQKDGEQSPDMSNCSDLCKKVCEAINDGTITVADMDAIVAAIKQRMDANGNDGDEPQDGTNKPAPAASPGAGEAMSNTPQPEEKMTAEVAALRGKLDAQEARLNERDASDKRRDDVSAAMKKLEGRPLGADLEQKLTAFHKEHGEKAFGAYVQSMADTFAKLPSPDRATAAFASQTNGAPVSDVASKYQEAGVEAVQQAAKFSREWKELDARGLTHMPEDRYVAVAMGRRGIHLKKKA